MQTLIFKLNESFQRPLIALKDYNDLQVLIDTGAELPLWTADKEDLIAVGGQFISHDFEYFGVNHIKHKNDLYCIKAFKLGLITFNTLYVVFAPDEYAKYDMLLSATVFKNLEYTINDKTHFFKISDLEPGDLVRNFIFTNKDGHTSILVTTEEETPCFI